ncbi:MAG: hypothetical protein V9F01_01025 [Chitinophagaceae bacterium]
MPIKLTLDIFSGRPNPEVMLDDKTARELLKRLSFGTFRKQNDNTNPFPSVLGYRGLIIEQSGKLLSKDLPQVMHYAHDTIYAGDKAAKAEEGLESFLFDNFKSLKNIKGFVDFRRITENLIKDFIDKRDIYIENHRKWFDKTLDDFMRPVKPVCPCALQLTWQPGTVIRQLLVVITVIIMAPTIVLTHLPSQVRQQGRNGMTFLPVMFRREISVLKWELYQMDLWISRTRIINVYLLVT